MRRRGRRAWCLTHEKYKELKETFKRRDAERLGGGGAEKPSAERSRDRDRDRERGRDRDRDRGRERDRPRGKDDDRDRCGRVSMCRGDCLLLGCVRKLLDGGNER